MPWQPPDLWVETQGQLRMSSSVKLDATGQGTITFDPDHANQRWVVESVVVSASLVGLPSAVPIVNLALNSHSMSTLSLGNQLGSTYSGNQDSFTGSIDVGPCDFLTVLFAPAPGATVAQIAYLSGTVCTAIITGSKFSRRK